VCQRVVIGSNDSNPALGIDKKALAAPLINEPTSTITFARGSRLPAPKLLIAI
jgi:hypothetical protein